MDKEYSIILMIQIAIFIVLWPQFVRSFSRWKNKALRHDNPNLNKCYYLRMWGPPVFVMVVSMIFLHSISLANEQELVDKIFISLLVLFGSVFTGTLITEIFVDHYKIDFRHHQ